jgi:hypothetical protein
MTMSNQERYEYLTTAKAEDMSLNDLLDALWLADRNIEDLEEELKAAGGWDNGIQAELTRLERRYFHMQSVLDAREAS